MSNQEPQIVVLGANPEDGVDYLAGERMQAPEQYIPLRESLLPEGGLPEPGQSLPYDDSTLRERFTRRIQTVRRVGKWGVRGAVVAGLVSGGMYLKDLIDDFSPDTSHKLEVDISAPETQVYPNQALDFAQVISSYEYSQKTSLDRIGPFNCDVTIAAEGDNKVRTETDGEVVVDQLTITRVGNTATIGITGDLALSRTAVDWSDGFFADRMDIGSVDVCIGVNEVNWATTLADTITEQAGQVAAACAVGSEAGQQVFEQSVRDFALRTPLLNGVDPSNVAVEMGDFDAEAAKLLIDTQEQFSKEVDDIVGEYLDETADHEDPDINDEDLMDCSMHTITVGENT